MPASLHPVPRRPSGPVDDAAARRHLGALVPGLDEEATRALAMVALAGRSRGDAARELALDGERLAGALARGRKSLRRSLVPLAGSGWCERAERLISDRLDGALEQPGAGRLGVHLRNCPRCVEHERRLVQATDRLTETFEQAYGAPASPPESQTVAPALAVVRPAAGPRSLPFGKPVRPAPPPVMEEASLPAVAPAEPEPPATRPASVPAALRRFSAPSASAVAWGALLVLAVLVTAAGIALALAGILGAIH